MAKHTTANSSSSIDYHHHHHHSTGRSSTTKFPLHPSVSQQRPSSPTSVLELHKHPAADRSVRRRKRPFDNHQNNDDDISTTTSTTTTTAMTPPPPTTTATTALKRPNCNRSVASESKKSVRFHQRVKTRKIPSHRTFTMKERCDSWYHDREYRMIERRNERTIQKIEDSWCSKNGHVRSLDPRHTLDGSGSGKNDDDKLCARGLEYGLDAEYLTFEAHKRSAYRAVFREQERQHDLGIECDDVALAKVCSRATKKSRFRARTRALLDRKEAKAELRPEKRNQNDDGGGDWEETSARGGLALRKQFAAVRSWVHKAKNSSRHDRRL